MQAIQPLPTLRDMARKAGESAHPRLWRDLAGMWLPCLGRAGDKIRDWSRGGSPAVGVMTNMEGADWLPSPLGWSLDFDGSNERVTVSDIDQLDLTPNLSMLAVIRPTDSGNSIYRTIMAKRVTSSVTTNYQIYLSNAAANDAGVLGYYNGIAVFNSTTIPTVNTWSVVGATVQGTALTLFHNGQAIHTATLSVVPAVNAGNFSIGWSNWTASNEHFMGQIAAAIVWGRCLSRNEMRQLYADPLALVRPRQRWAAGKSVPTVFTADMVIDPEELYPRYDAPLYMPAF